MDVVFKSEYSSEKQKTSGVPQGSTVSPTLFDLMIGDVSQASGIIISEYVDDITLLL